MFDIEIAAQMSAWFIDKEGGRMPYLKLIKLLYLAERISIQRNNEPILGDDLVSMQHGPILSRTLDFIKGEETSPNWNGWVSSPSEDFEVSLAKKFRLENLDLLSKSTIEILEELWKEHASKDEWEMAEYTHDSCKEWRPQQKGSSSPISYKTLLSKGFRYDKEKTDKETTDLLDQRDLINELYKLGSSS